MSEAFEGFGPGAARLLEALAQENTKAFFDAHRQEYDREIRLPLEDLLNDAQERYGPGRVMRANRDMRFTNDKSPYRTDASMWAGRVGGVYVRLSPDGLQAGGGLYSPSRDQLARARHAIATHHGAAVSLRAAVAGLSGFTAAGPALKRAPRDYPIDHPEIDLLRMKHFAAVKELPATAEPAAVKDAWRAVEPLIAWADAHAG